MRTAFLDTRADHARNVWNAFRVKHAIRPPASCSCCGASARLEAHHPDYGQPLSVVWLCVPCHRREHAVLEVSQIDHPVAEVIARRRMTQSEFAALAGVSTCTLGRLFRGERLTPATAAKIEAAAQPATEAA